MGEAEPKRKIEQPGLDFGEQADTPKTQRPKTLVDYSTQQIQGFLTRIKNKEKTGGLTGEEEVFLEAWRNSLGKK